MKLSTADNRLIAAALDDAAAVYREKAESERGETMYVRRIAPRLHPAAVEIEVTGVVGGVRVRGRLDVIDRAPR